MNEDLRDMTVDQLLDEHNKHRAEFSILEPRAKVLIGRMAIIEFRIQAAQAGKINA
jgi:hypothetical protein